MALLDPRMFQQQQTQPNLGMLAQYNGMAGPQNPSQPAFNPNTLLALGAGIAGGRDWGEGLSRGFGGALQVKQADQQRQEKYGDRNATFQALLQRGMDPKQAWLMANSPQTAQALTSQENRQDDVAWRQSQADRAQGNADRSYDLQQKIANQGRTPPGWTQTPEGGLTYREGGPADPNYIQKTNAAKGKLGLSPAQTSVDKEYGKDYAEFVAGGGFADAQKNISQLRGVVDQLRSGKENLTGPVIGRSYDWMKQLTGNDAAIQARETVEEVVQRNLRIVLGAQFTEKEGERLISRAFNPNLSEAENAVRLERLITAMERGVQAKMEAAQYYEQNGTLQGYRGNVTVRPFDLERAMEGGGQRSTPAPMSVDPNKDQGRLPSGNYVYDPASGRLVPAR
jgi:hypothetical protein